MFESQNGDFDIKKEHINGNGEYVITAGLSNNGILGKTDIKAKIFEPKTITIDMFGCAFYRQFQYKMVTHARVFSLKPSFEITDKQGIFLSCSLNFLRFLFGYENMCSWEKIKNHKIKLPTTQNGEIDFEFMESFIAELEAERVRELEAYLKAADLANTTLSADEQNALNTLNSKIWQEFKIGDLFDVSGSKTTSKSYLEKIGKGDYPYITTQAINNGIAGFYNYFTEQENCLTIDSAVLGTCFWQNKNFSASDHVEILRPKNFALNQKIALFFTSLLNKNASILGYSYGMKRNQSRIKNENILLPITASGEIDFDFMESFIKAIQKECIKGVDSYLSKNIATTKELIK